MFEGVPAEQFHQFIMSSRTTVNPIIIPLSFPLDHGSSPSPFPSFDHSSFLSNSHHHQPFPPSSTAHLLQQTLLHHHHHHQSPPPSNSSTTNKHDQLQVHEASNTAISKELEELAPPSDPWPANEVLALLRIRSASLDNWFPDFTWDHVSRKLAELGYKRSAEKCKEKYEEETSRSINGIGYNKINKYLMIGELDEQILYPVQADQSNNHIVMARDIEHAICEADQEEKLIVLEEEDPVKEKEILDPPAASISREDEQVVIVNVPAATERKKRKSREKKFEMFKEFCEEIVSKMITQQQEFHEKLISDMVNRDEENIAKEEAWKKQEMERANKEMEARAHEQVIAGDRQATIIEFLNKFTPEKLLHFKINYDNLIANYPNIIAPQTPTSPCPPSVQHESHSTPTSTLQKDDQNPKFARKKASNVSKHQRKPNLASVDGTNPENPTYISNGRDDIGKRWPRDEVQTLINMRCNLHGSNNNHDDKDGGGSGSNKGGSLWEKISQGMSEMGYQRSAKRCKEKWENINKYFRKTKDVNKKRGVDSRTCPYFQQLSRLYNPGALTANHSTLPENNSNSPGNHLALPYTCS